MMHDRHFRRVAALRSSRNSGTPWKTSCLFPSPRNVNHKQPLVTKDGLDRRRILPKSLLVEAVRFESQDRPESCANASGDRPARCGARRLLARPRLPPIRGHAPSAPRYGLPCVGCVKQTPNAVFQQSDSTLQGAELSKPHYRDGHVQVK
jgi:hypothetical protein